jgi:Domain of unknown function (DUF4326)
MNDRTRPKAGPESTAQTITGSVTTGTVTTLERPPCALCPICSCGYPECQTAKPRRVRMTRRMPWRHLAPDAVIVDRRSRWGNPYPVAEHGRRRAVAMFRWRLYSTPGLLDQARAELAGRDIACWCPLDEDCHADVLLAAMNGGAS